MYHVQKDVPLQQQIPKKPECMKCLTKNFKIDIKKLSEIQENIFKISNEIRKTKQDKNEKLARDL